MFTVNTKDTRTTSLTSFWCLVIVTFGPVNASDSFDHLKHLRIRKSQLLVTTQYLQIPYHDLKVKLTLGIPFVNKNGQLFHQLGHVAFSKHVF